MAEKLQSLHRLKKMLEIFDPNLMPITAISDPPITFMDHEGEKEKKIPNNLSANIAKLAAIATCASDICHPNHSYSTSYARGGNTVVNIQNGPTETKNSQDDSSDAKVEKGKERTTLGALMTGIGITVVGIGATTFLAKRHHQTSNLSNVEAAYFNFIQQISFEEYPNYLYLSDTYNNWNGQIRQVSSRKSREIAGLTLGSVTLFLSSHFGYNGMAWLGFACTLGSGLYYLYDRLTAHDQVQIQTQKFYHEVMVAILGEETKINAMFFDQPPTYV